MADEVTVQMAVAPVAADMVPLPPTAEAELATISPEQEHKNVIGGLIAAVTVTLEHDEAQYNQLQKAISKQEADVKKKLAEVVKASEKKIRSPKIDELKSMLLQHLPQPNQALKLAHFKTHFGANYTDDEYEQALKELIELGSVQTRSGLPGTAPWYWRKRDARG